SGGGANISLIAGILVLAFCASSLAGFMLGAIFLRRGASLVRLQTHFLSSDNHELRTPMTSIRMFVEALLDDRLTDPDERHRCLGVLRREVVRLDGLVDRLIELSRIESSAQPYRLEPVEVRPLFDTAIAAVDAFDLQSRHPIALEVESCLSVVGDRDAMPRALSNLLSKAWKYTGPDKRISTPARACSERHAEIAVSDNGPDIPLKEQKRVFEKFVRGSAADGGGISGSGL